jgi:hypothetical protein
VPVFGFQQGERYCAVTQRHMPGGDALALRGAPTREIVRLGHAVADALAYLHELGVVHRDVKASNVLLDEAGRAHLADFGIASAAQGDEEEGIVVRGGGSRASMSPQQRQGGPAAPADDLYALGVLLFELLAGRPPAEPDAAASAPTLWTLPIPERLRGLVASLLAPLPEARPRSAAAARDELEGILAELARDAPAAARVERRAPEAAQTYDRNAPGYGGEPPGARRERNEVRLQPPPRMGEPARREQERELFVPRPSGDAAGQRLQLAVVGVLVLAAIAAAFWLPGWAERRSAPQAAPLAEAAPTSSAPSPVGERAEPPTPPEATPVAEASAASARAPEPVARAASPPDEPARAVPSEPVPQPEPTPDREAEARTLAAHRDAGQALEAREQWRGAVQQYEAALAIDPHVSFAVEGRERAEKRAALDEAMDAHIARPDRLGAPAVGREAEALLERASAVEPSGPGLQSKIAALEKALAAARQPVAVVIESDGLTELTLSRVGRLGPLTRRKLELLPGTYTVIGSRRGYRDVRRQFSVAPGAPAPPVIALRCDEAL